MSDETTPPQGEAGGLSPEEVAFNVEVERLEKVFREAGLALLAHVGAVGVCIPFVDEQRDGQAFVVSIGTPLKVLNMTLQACEEFAGRQGGEFPSMFAVLRGGPRVQGLGEAISAMLAQRMAGQSEDGECDCERCVAQREKPN